MLVRLVFSKDPYRGNFRFDKRFLNKPLVKETILTCWNQSSMGGGGDISVRLRNVRKCLSRWKKENNLNSQDKINQLQIALEVEQSSFLPCFNHLRFLKKELMFAYREEEKYWS